VDRLENKLDSVVASLHDIDKKVDRLTVQVEDIQARTVAHDGLTTKLETRVAALEKWADLFPKIKAIAGWIAALGLALTYLYTWFGHGE
jgi:peptidoglycan hydrolase CwlO-like protein